MFIFFFSSSSSTCMVSESTHRLIKTSFNGPCRCSGHICRVFTRVLSFWLSLVSEQHRSALDEAVNLHLQWIWGEHTHLSCRPALMSSCLESWVCRSSWKRFTRSRHLPCPLLSWSSANSCWFSCASCTWRIAATCQHSRQSFRAAHIPALKTQDTHKTVTHSIWTNTVSVFI